MTTARVEPATRVSGTVAVPGDKSISHRALLLGALARGRSYVGNLSPADDVARTAACLAACGAGVRPFGEDRALCEGAGTGRSLQSPTAALDCGNSGTTMRLLAGVLAHHDLEAVLDGDASLRRRPMRRVAGPLTAMGAVVTTAEGGTAPLTVRGRRPLHGGEHDLPVASAQLASAILFAGLGADGPVTVRLPAPARDHTERMFRMCGIDVAAVDGGTRITPGSPEPFGLRIPGDLSSAAFLLALAAAIPGGDVTCTGVTLNPGRTGILEVLAAMGAEVTVEEGVDAGGHEPTGDVRVRAGALTAVRIGDALVPRLLDELPVLAVLATQCDGVTEISGAAELRVKESDRIATVVAGLRAFGADVEERPDGMVIQGRVRLHAARVDAAGDHRLAMAWAVAGSLAAGGPTAIDGAECVAVSWPSFFADLASVAG